MRRVLQEMHRYGEADFDAEYMNWGMHGRRAQVEQAESVLRLVAGKGPQRILDLACGVGTHAILWAQHGHSVLGVDISATFVQRAQQAAAAIPRAEFRVSDIRALALGQAFTLATWIEMSFIDVGVLKRVHQALLPGGCFICDVRNPEHPRTKARAGDWRTWQEVNGTFLLERHETNAATGKREDAWITIDPSKDLIEEKTNVSEPGLKDPAGIAAALEEARFSHCELCTMSGEQFRGGCEPYWLWAVARK